MVEAAVQQQLDAINTKLDIITGELIQVKRQREELEDLKEDITIVAKDVFSSAVTELEEVAPFVRTGDYLHLFKKILRNTSTVTGVVEQLESALDFYQDAKPISKNLFNDALEKMDELDRKGYFTFLRELARIADNVVTHFKAEDVSLLADNIVTILETMKGLTQPEMLKTVNNAATVFKNLDPDDIEEYSVFKLMKEVNSPEIKRGLGFLVSFLKNVSDTAPSKTV